ncbi:MAG: lamin tail domain-containing protein [Clostridia bacterium]|nr:lamin tail domain-containing protein [Clostridia bacterium]
MAKRRKRKNRYGKQDVRMPLLLLLLGVLLLIVIVSPKEKTIKALNVTSTGVQSTHAGLRISEVMTDNTSAYPDELGKFGDWVELENTTDAPMNLKGVGLSDRSDRIIFLFPDVTLAANGRVCVFLDDVNRDVPGNALHGKFKLSSLGETVYLFDANGVSIDHVQVPTLNSDESYALMDHGSFEKTFQYSPGYPNGETGYYAYMDNYTVIPGQLMINEVMPSPRSGIRDEDDELSDWVELYNLSNEDIYLGNLALSDDPGKPVKWIFPQNAVIPANGYYLVFCSGKDKVEVSTAYPHTNFSISNQEETLVLSTVTGELIDRVTVANLERDTSYGRNAEDFSKWQVYTLATPGAPNNEYGQSRADQYMRGINFSGVYVTEVMASAAEIQAINGLGASDYVEIYNSSTQTWDLSGWGLSDNINWPLKWTFPKGTSIFPGQHMVVLLDGSEDPGSNAQRLHASFSLTRAGGEIITFSDATGRVLDKMYLPEIPTDISYGRTQGATGFFYYDAPTPGQENGRGFTGFSQKPVFDLKSGLYKGKISVTISVPEGTTVRYTLDGSIPTIDNGFLYYDGCEDLTDFSQTKVIRARAFEAGKQPSDTVTASYIMNTYHDMDVVSLICEPHELWDELTGLLSEAPDPRFYKADEELVVDKSELPFETPVYRNWGKVDRPGYVELFNKESGEAYISQGIKMDLLGAYSLDMPQKSFKIRAQAAYGEKYFNYPLFEDRPYTFYKSFTLRNSGNDNVWTRVADAVQTSLVDKYLNQDVMLTLSWRPVAVYLNGQYWGHYNLRERKDRFSIAQFEGVDLEDKETLENITILRAGWSVVQGSNEEYRAMLKEIEQLSPNTNPEDLQYLYDHIDIENYIEWFAVKMFFGDSDPGNIMFYKMPAEGSKWKCLLFDLDYGMFDSGFNSPWSYLKTTGMGRQNINNTIFRKMMESDVIRDQFLTRLGVIFQTLTTEVMQQELETAAALIYPELQRHYARWAQFKEPTINIDSPTSAEGYMRYWRVRVDRMKNETMVYRPYRLWGFVQEQFGLTNDQMVYYFGARPANPDAE